MGKTLFEEQIIPLADKMFRYAFSILKDPESAQDVVQECLVKIWNARQKLTGIRSTEAWAMRITRNQCYDWVKTNRYMVLSDKDMDRSDTQSADQQMLVNDHMKWLDTILKTLPEKQQEIYHLREVEDMPYQDIAEILSLSLSEVKVYLHRARTKIKSSIEKIDAYGVAN